MNPELNNFLNAIQDDNRISPAHISLFLAILQCLDNSNGVNPIQAFSYQLMPLAKISSIATYHRIIHELSEYGYIKYKPSYNHFTGSLIFIQ